MRRASDRAALAQQARGLALPVLYVTQQGVEVHCRRGCLALVRDGREVFAQPVELVEHLVIFGAAHLTARAVAALLDHEIETSFISLHGRYRGRLHALASKNITLRREQFRRADDRAFCLHFARAIVHAKLTSQYYACLRWGRQASRAQARAAARSAAEKVNAARRQAQAAEDVRSLLGIEGTGTRAYYSALRAVVADKFPFPRRTRRPPQDPVSLLLGFAAALLQARVAAAVNDAGFDPFLGFYHSCKYGRPALVLDMMEEFRPVLADAVAAAVINLRMVRHEHIDEDEDGLLLTPGAAAAVARAFERKLNEKVRHPHLAAALPYSRLPFTQARLLARFVMGEADQYTPFFIER